MEEQQECSVHVMQAHQSMNEARDCVAVLQCALSVVACAMPASVISGRTWLETRARWKWQFLILTTPPALVVGLKTPLFF